MVAQDDSSDRSVLTGEIGDVDEAGMEDPSTAASAPAPDSGLPSVIGRTQILVATLEIETEDVSRRFEDAGNIATQHGGFVASSTFGTHREAPTASLTIRIPAENYQSAVVDLRKLGEVTAVDQGGSDVTEEFTDLESRLRGLRAVETQYLEFLSRAATIDEVLLVQDRINGVRVEIEQVQGRINMLANQADLATITIHLAAPVAPADEASSGSAPSPAEALVNGWEASIAVLTVGASVVLAVLAFSWWLVPVWLVVGYFVRRQVRIERARRDAATPPSAAAG
jgi:hypothetical protein